MKRPFRLVAWGVAVFGALAAKHGVSNAAGRMMVDPDDTYPYVTNVIVEADKSISISVKPNAHSLGGVFSPTHGPCASAAHHVKWGKLAYAVDTDLGRAMMSVALASFMARKTIRVFASCTAASDLIISELETNQP